MAKYLKNPVYVEAVQFDGSNDSAMAIYNVSGVIGIKRLTGGDLEVMTTQESLSVSRYGWVIVYEDGHIEGCEQYEFRVNFRETN